MTVDLILTSPEALHIAYTIDSQEDYPVGTGRSGGEQFRLQFLRLAQLHDAGPHMLALTRDELWLLDGALLPEARSAKLPDGNPVLGLLYKVWDALIEAYAEGDSHARDEDDRPHADARAGDGAAPVSLA